METYRILIVEDELPAREGIANAIRRDAPQFEIVGELEDGLTAVEAVHRERPDIVVTDIAMPRMSGLEMIELIHCEYPEISVVIVSGYDDFSYAQQALRYGVKDYLLKPVASEQLLGVLARLAGELRQWRRYGELGADGSALPPGAVPLARERFLIELLTGATEGVPEQGAGGGTEAEGLGALAARASSLGLDGGAGYYCVVLFRCFESSGSPGSELKRKANADLILSQLAEDLLPLGIGHYAVPLEGGAVALVLAARDLTRNELFLVIEQTTQLIISGLRRYAALHIHAGIGRPYRELPRLRDSFSEAKDALDYCYLKEGSAVVNYSDLISELAPSVVRPADLEEEFIVAVKTGDRAACVDALAGLEKFYRGRDKLDPRFVRTAILELFSRLFERLGVLGEDQAHSLVELRLVVLDEIAKRASLGAMMVWMAEHSSLIMDVLERQGSAAGSSRIKKVIALVELNLGSPGLVLDDVAAQVYLSPNYLRALFKRETGQSFVEFLTDVRMKKAAQLLSTTQMRVQEIAEAVGYPNQRYFAMCFKKAYSMAPSEYRAFGPGMEDLKILDIPQ